MSDFFVHTEVTASTLATPKVFFSSESKEETDGVLSIEGECVFSASARVASLSGAPSSTSSSLLFRPNANVGWIVIVESLAPCSGSCFRGKRRCYKFFSLDEVFVLVVWSYQIDVIASCHVHLQWKCRYDFWSTPATHPVCTSVWLWIFAERRHRSENFGCIRAIK